MKTTKHSGVQLGNPQSNWDYCELRDVVSKGSSSIALNNVKNEDGAFPLFAAQGFVRNISYFEQAEEYLAIIKDGAGIGRITKHPGKSSVVATMQYLIPRKGFDIDFIKYFLQGMSFEKYRNGSTIPHIYFKDYGSERFPKLPLPEQKRIVAILDEAFAAIDKAKANTERNLRNAKELFESYLQGVFEKKGVGWEERHLGEFAEFRNGINYSKGSKGEKVKIVGIKDFQDSYWVPNNDLAEVSLDDKINETDLLEEGDILAVRSNGNPQLIGRTLLVGKINERVSHSGFTIRIRLSSKIVNPNFLCRFLKIQQTRRTLVESGNGIGIRSLNQGSLSSLKIPFPKSSREQEIIINRVDSLAELCQKLNHIYQKKIDDLEELKKSILQKAFAGELRSADTVEVKTEKAVAG